MLGGWAVCDEVAQNGAAALVCCECARVLREQSRYVSCSSFVMLRPGSRS